MHVLDGSLWSRARPQILVLVSMMVLVAGRARAETPRQTAKAAYAEGAAAYEAHDYATAKTKFEQAHAALPLKAFWFNIAQCEYQLGHYAAAATAYERYLEDNAHVPDRALVESYLEEAKARAALSETEQKALQAAQTAQQAEQQRLAAERAQKEVEAALQAAERTAQQERVQREQLEEESQSLFKQWWFWSAIAGGAAVVAAGAAATAMGAFAAYDFNASQGTLGSEQLGGTN